MMMSADAFKAVKRDLNVFIWTGKRLEETPNEKGRKFFGTTASLTTGEHRPLRSGAADRVEKTLKAEILGADAV
jgi:hypothetical protein